MRLKENGDFWVSLALLDKSKPVRSMWFIQSDSIRESYDSYKMLETKKSKDYLTRDELAQLEQR